MKIKNESQEFDIRYNSKVYTIPNGEMEITNDAFATFIVSKAKQWGFDVVKTGKTEALVVKPIEVIEKETVKETPVEETVEPAKVDTATPIKKENKKK